MIKHIVYSEGYTACVTSDDVLDLDSIADFLECEVSEIIKVCIRRER